MVVVGCCVDNGLACVALRGGRRNAQDEWLPLSPALCGGGTLVGVAVE